MKDEALKYISFFKLSQLSANRPFDEKIWTRDANITAVERVAFVIDGTICVFRVNADTRCGAVQEFLKRAAKEAIVLAIGPEGGKKIGLSEGGISGLNIYFEQAHDLNVLPDKIKEIL